VAGELEIRPLRPDDDRGGFSCGQPDLDRFFHHYAGQNQFRLHLAVTYVAVAERRIVGFATVSAGSLERRTLPSPRMRRRLPGYPLPVLRLARPGVDERAQGLGVGRALLRHVLALALGQRDSVGCVGVVTDAKPEAATFYARYGFAPLEGVREGALHGGATPLFLAVGAVAAAREA
jgi:GNAT superfamily N-acetyltransferase